MALSFVLCTTNGGGVYVHVYMIVELRFKTSLEVGSDDCEGKPILQFNTLVIVLLIYYLWCFI